ncbi:iron-containing alcohol dehydrogenase [Kitasatospora sp. NPDC059408]|uniref:iron-containing alcohol dehydrogenase n=1 Tax=Kitasatospora sp. NPDC059408 TaxID=3346823 RepID=UPI0036CDEF69
MTGGTDRPGPPAVWRQRTQIHFGEGALAEVWRRVRAHRTVLVVDADQPGLAESLPHDGEVIRVDPLAGDLDSAVVLAGQLREFERVVVVGGGAVLDQAALARLFTAAPGTPTRIRLGGSRPGLVHGGPAEPLAGPHPELVAVPTTVGTAAEVSCAATVLVEGRRKLVMHPLLSADTAVLDPVATASLPGPLLREGTLEAMMRMANAYLMPPGRRCPAAAETEARDLLRELAAAGSTGRPAAEVAVLSARTVLGLSMVGRDPFAAKTWFLANELSASAGVRKMAATAAVLPVVWRRIMAGDARLGDRDRLRQAWDAVRAGAPGLADDPVHGIRTLAADWGVDAFAGPAPAPADLARSAARAWGGGLPMLAGFTVHELTELYAEVLEAAP